ncbi:MAG: hypothetical protein DRQ10_03035 [Candidatus Hydrothermota bacterium]|nr:MAG: hypothetical protein DRQ10_03035 [Candidatus Hydrothermae bacterium]
MTPLTVDERSLEIYLKEIAELPQLTEEEERELIRRAQAGDKEAREKLIYSYLKFVVAVAKRYQGYGVPLADLINEGNLGLLRALQRFDLNRKVRFLSYANWWIRQAIMKALHEQSRLIRVSPESRAKLKRVKEAESDLMQETGEEPTFEEIAKELGVSPEEVKKAYDIAIHEISIEQPVYRDSDKVTLADILDQDALPSPEKAYEERERRDKIREALKILKPRDRRVLELYFGLRDGRPRTLEEIGREMGVSRERIRQLKDRALRQIRERFGKVLEDFVEE